MGKLERETFAGDDRYDEWLEQADLVRFPKKTPKRKKRSFPLARRMFCSATATLAGISFKFA